MIPDWPTFWTAVSSVGQVLSIVLALAALLYSIRTFNRSILHTHYGALDQMYSELLKLGIERPHLRAPNPTRTPDQQLEYESYAHLAWVFVESVYDHATLNKSLLDSWRSAVEIETRLHRDWLERTENKFMFKDAFHRYIATEFPRSIEPPHACQSATTQSANEQPNVA